ncbi:MAG TPA: DMT family transporter [Candidatus Cybelea sp.]|nr:DMT family transporter [Candidatus Cybelea sp.]
MNPQSQYRLGLVLVTASAIAWSAAGYFTRLVPLDNWTLLFWRGLFAAAGLIAYMMVTQGRATWLQFAALGKAGLLFALLSAGAMICYITSLTMTTVAHVAIIYGTVPFLAAGLGWLVLHERPSGTAITASLIALVGVALMVGGNVAEGSLRGDALAFGMTLGMAAIIVINRHNRAIPMMHASCVSALISAAIAWPLSAAGVPSPAQLCDLALFGLINLALGMILFTLGSRLIPAVETALIGSLDGPLAPVWVWLAFGERPGHDTILGGILVFGAVVANVVLGTRSSRKAAMATQSGMD